MAFTRCSIQTKIQACLLQHQLPNEGGFLATVIVDPCLNQVVLKIVEGQLHGLVADLAWIGVHGLGRKTAAGIGGGPHGVPIQNPQGGSGKARTGEMGCYTGSTTNKGGCMRYEIILVVLLAGCAGSYDLTLFPKGGGAQAKGTADGATKSMTVTLNGKTYAGNYVQATSKSVGSMTQGANMPATAVGLSSSNQFMALLAGDDGAIRCEFMATRSAGNGVCTDSHQRSYDLLIRAK